MNTLPTHLVINAALGKKFGSKFGFAKSAFLWGSVVPDFPLLLLTLGFLIYNRYFAVEPVSGMMNSAFDDLYFNNPWWIAGHNFLHSPTALALYAMFLWRFRNLPNTAGHRWLWFVFGAMVHSVIDVLTHHNDGPLLLWPFDWHLRFLSPISYWDTAYYASQFVYFEVGLNVALLGYLVLPGTLRRIKKAVRKT